MLGPPRLRAAVERLQELGVDFLIPGVKLVAHAGHLLGHRCGQVVSFADVVLQDDRFPTVAAAVEEGRVIFDNVRKFVFYLFSCNVAEIAVVLGASAVGAPLPLLPLQILWLNLVTNGIQDVALAFEGGEPGVMKHKPRPTDEGLFNRLMVTQTIISGLTMGALAFSTWAWFSERLRLSQI